MTSGKPSSHANALRKLADLGQSVWLDSISRSFIRSGNLKKLVEEDGLKGVTSNPTIFEKAIGQTGDYDRAIEDLLRQRDQDANEIYEALAIEDIQDAADVLLPAYRATQGHDGFVSLEVSPLLALSAEGTIDEARRLWRKVNRPNVMIKVPGTSEGLVAFRQLISEGININVTLLFSQDRYEEFADAYIEGLEVLAERGSDFTRVASVASFFVSRIDTAVDNALAEKVKNTRDPNERAHLSILIGKIAISNAKLAYRCYQHLFSSSRWKKLASRGARTQRLLWASTGTKNPAYKDTLYIEELIGKDTVNTMPLKTMDAFREHGAVCLSLTEDVGEAQEIMDDLESAGVSIDKITDELLNEGIHQFVEPFQRLMSSIERKRVAFHARRLGSMVFALSEDDRKLLDVAASEWQRSRKTQRLWARDATLWTGKDEASWLGWLDIVDRQLERTGELDRFAREVETRGFETIVLLGMGGSSLCPEVLGVTFRGDCPRELQILDSTDPGQIMDLSNSLRLNQNPEKILFIVSSKSGKTLEPTIFQEYFFSELSARVGREAAAKQFVAITDPGSALEKRAHELGFWKVFFGDPEIGGRYSALSDFGMVPAAAMGIPVREFLASAQLMERSCSRSVPVDANPGVQLGLLLGTLASQPSERRKDKLTLICSREIWDLGAWLEQLVAESTGKSGTGLIPISEESLGSPEAYEKDRIFVYLKLDESSEPELDPKVLALEKAGHAVVRITLADKMALGQAFIHWEVATAVAGSCLKINPFDQPDVEASKVETRKLTAEFEKTGELPREEAIVQEGSIQLFANQNNAQELFRLAKEERSLEALLAAHFERVTRGDYVAVLTFAEMSSENWAIVQKLRLRIRDALKVGTTLEFGPRFLHSTGQAYKGGPNTGVFLQLTCEHADDVAIPGHKYSFGVIEAAQAKGDLRVLQERGRRVIHIHLGRDVAADLQRLDEMIDRALARMQAPQHVKRAAS
jgi:transaldolase/glucose-6-phosphate isomerase